jgi:hypothetical protein
MVFKLYDLATADEGERSSAIEPVRLPVNSTALTKLSATDRRAEFDARDNGHFSRNNNVGNESAGQRESAEVSPRTRILSAAAKLTSPTRDSRITGHYRPLSEFMDDSV